MEKLFDFANKNKNLSLSDILYIKLEEQKQEDIDLVNRKYFGEKRENVFKQLESDYRLMMNKLSYVPELAQKDEKLQKRFAEVFLYIDNLDLKMGSKLDCITAYACALISIPTHVELLSDEDSFLISMAFVGISIDDYYSYGAVITNESLLKLMNSKTSDNDKKLEMIYMFFKRFDNLYTDDITKKYHKVLYDCKRIVESYQIRNIKEK